MKLTHSSPLQVVPAASASGGNQSNFERLMPAEEAAALLGGIHVKTLQRKARIGEIPGRQIGRAWYFRASELDAWLRSLVRFTSANPSAA